MDFLYLPDVIGFIVLTIVQTLAVFFALKKNKKMLLVYIIAAGAAALVFIPSFIYVLFSGVTEEHLLFYSYVLFVIGCSTIIPLGLSVFFYVKNP